MNMKKNLNPLVLKLKNLADLKRKMSFPNISKNTELKIQEKRNNIVGLNDRLTERLKLSKGKCEASDRLDISSVSNYRNEVHELEDKIRRLDTIISKWRN